MRDKIIRGMLILTICLVNVKNVKAETIINLKIPEEIKLDGCEKPDIEESKIGDFKDYTEIESFIKQSEILPLQKIAIAEAGSAGIETMAYVMQTIINRKLSNEFPDDVEEIIKQEGQFSTYPKKYNNAVPNMESEQAFLLMQTMENKGQLYFENTKPGSWQSTHKELVLEYGKLSFYK